MDMSKLPKLSQSPSPPPADDPATDARPGPGPDYATEPVASPAAEAWIGITVGLILLFMSPFTLQWLISLVSSYKPPFLPITDSTTGLEVPYTKSIFFFGQLCAFVFSITLIADGCILFTRKPALIMAAFVVTLLSSAMNLFFVTKSVLGGEAFPLLSGLAVAFGVYIAMFQWRLLRALRTSHRA